MDNTAGCSTLATFKQLSVKAIVSAAFEQQFHVPATLVVRSPGRINLIGEHTDYNNGFVLPAAIDKAVFIAIGKREDEVVNLLAIDSHETHEATIHNLQRASTLWPDYILGVVDELQKAGYTLGGFNAAVTGNVPVGAGLSSSAALECAVVFALNELFALNIPRITMVQIAQRAENNFVGMQCGIMDQFASIMGKQGQVIKLDCESLAYEYFPLQLPGYKVLLLDTQVKHSLASSEYNTRRKECQAGVALLQAKYPQVQSLRNATQAMIEELVADEVIKKRCLFIVQENERLLTGCAQLLQGNVAAFGAKMFTTHEGLSNMYEVSCPELDYFVDFVKDNASVLGARMMGGGFGGCTINLVKEDAINGIIAQLKPAYLQAFGKELKYYIASVEDGTAVV
jgi:galactokinase